MEIGPEDKACLDEFSNLRAQWIHEIKLPVQEEDVPHYQAHNIEELDTHELLISEVRKEPFCCNSCAHFLQPYLLHHPTSISSRSHRLLSLILAGEHGAGPGGRDA